MNLICTINLSGEMSIGNIISIVSLVVAFVFSAISLLNSVKRSKTQYTLGVLSMKFSNNEIFHAYKLMTSKIINEEYVREAELSEEDHEAIERLLAYFEFISVGYLQKDINRKIVEMQIKSGIRETYKYCSAYIQNRRDSIPRPGLYSELEKVAKKFGLEKDFSPPQHLIKKKSLEDQIVDE